MVRSGEIDPYTRVNIRIVPEYKARFLTRRRPWMHATVFEFALIFYDERKLDMMISILRH